MAESGTKNIKFACALTANLGMEIHALSDNHAAAGSSGMTQVCNAIVLMDSSGMVEHAFSAQTEKYGMSPAEVASVRLELNGMDSSALLSSNVKEDRSGIKTLGLVSALQQQSGTTCTALPTAAKEVKFGTT